MTIKLKDHTMTLEKVGYTEDKVTVHFRMTHGYKIITPLDMNVGDTFQVDHTVNFSLFSLIKAILFKKVLDAQEDIDNE